MDAILARLSSTRLVPVIEVPDGADTPGLAAALLEGGVDVAEITFRTAGAAAAIAAIRAAEPAMLVGAGTLLTPAQVDAACDAGAQFGVSPGFGPAVVARARERGLPIIPGVVTPSEISVAFEAGFRVLKFFPAEAFGGADYLRAIAAPFAGVRFMPTGGINATNLPDYLALANVIACGGSWFVRRDRIAARDWPAISAAAAAAMEIVRSVRTG